MREQDLRGGEPVFAKGRFVDLHQAHLPHGGGGLQLIDFMRTRFPAEPLHTFGDRATRDQQHVDVTFSQRRKLIRPVLIGMYRRQLDKEDVDCLLAELEHKIDDRAEQMEIATLIRLSNRVHAAILEKGKTVPGD